MPNSTFVATLLGREMLRVDDNVAKWLEVEEQLRAVLNGE